MLDTDTKRRIDTARDILVGKVPDPKSQVEQITIALIYKFMDDMDAEAEELGGKRKFFTGKFARYGWVQLMRAGLGGHEMLGLYAEGITKMPENPGIPLLFRDIFKNAYLPYRDPETLKAFLKIIDEFNYDHSERLGDAFEYLLSVLGSQGDAGQFRTPRHIIDFIVEVLDPKKNESVLDPACGTAGFLISAYKHILKANSSPQAIVSKDVDENDKAALDSSRIPSSRGDLLTPDERGRLATNFKGYDISPDMVRLSLVNLYLHGFTDPHIYEYDTLTSEERWSEFADVILANPPFMSPKGGIKPHKRFSIQAKRSEVLFVDYMAEHLTPTGRAGIIVPEGVIFQSQAAYKELRKLLVENSLVAVISLPAGCFNPYSGVKTSIIILDKALGRQSDTIAFFKVENDGFGLGAQRRAIGGSDLPQVKTELTAYLGALRSQKSIADLQTTCGLIVPKEQIAANGDYSLSGERYREGDQRSSEYPHVELGEVVDVLDSLRRPITKSDRKPGPYPYYGATGVLDHVEGYLFDEPLVLVGEDGAKWGPGENSAFPVDGKIWVNNHAHVLRPKRDRLLDGFLIELLNEADLLPYVTGVTVPKLNQEKLRSIQIPLPPVEVQKEIVAEIESYQRVINGARAVLDNYRPHIPIHPDWPMVPLGDIADVKLGKMLDQAKHDKGKKLPYARNVSVRWGSIDTHDLPEMYFEEDELERFGLRKGDVLVCEGGEPGRAAVWDGRIPGLKYQKALHRVRFKLPYEPSVLVFLLQEMALSGALVGWLSGTTIKHLTLESFNKLPVPFPPLATQQAIVAEIEAEQALVAANRELVARFEQKIQATLARIWGEDETTVAEAVANG
jgi:type I restriction enzyme M protein